MEPFECGLWWTVAAAIGFVAALALLFIAWLEVIWQAMIFRGNLLRLREYIEDLSHNTGMDYPEILRAAIAEINAMLGGNL